MLDLARFKLVDLVGNSTPVLVTNTTEALGNGVRVEAVKQDCRLAGTRKSRPIRREPVPAIEIAFPGVDGDVTRIECGGEKPENSLSATSIPAVEDDYRPFAVDDLRKLKLMETLLNVSERRRIIPGERTTSFETR